MFKERGGQRHYKTSSTTTIHRKNCLLTRYLIKHWTILFKPPSRYIHDTRGIHATVYLSHMDVDPCKWYYLNGTAPLPLWIRAIHMKTPLKWANSQVKHPSHTTAFYIRCSTLSYIAMQLNWYNFHQLILIKTFLKNLWNTCKYNKYVK